MPRIDEETKQQRLERISLLLMRNARGLIREGLVADITVFDPAVVADKATFAKPHQYAEGITFVIVNGVVVLDDGEMTGVLPGRPIRGPGVEASPK